MLAFDWEPSIDPDGDPVRYNLFIAKDDKFNNEAIAIRNLKTSMHFVTEKAGLQDLTPYYWKVEAVDSFGAITASEARRFNTNNGNRGYTAINLAVRSDLFAPVCVPKGGFQFKHNGKVIQPDIVVEENCGDNIIIFSNPKPADYDVEIKTPNYNPYKKRVRVKSKVAKVGTTNEIVWLNNDIQQEQIILNRLCHPNCDDHGSLELLQANTAVAENERTVTLYVQRVGGYDSEVAVAYNFNGGNAEFGSDNSNDTGMTGTLSWGDGDGQTKSITVPISDDNTYEGNETFNVNLSTPSGGAKLGAISQTIVTVVDDDAVELIEDSPSSTNEQCDKTTIVAEPKDGGSTAINGSVISPVAQLNKGNLLFISDNYRINAAAGTFTMRVARINGSDGEIAVKIATQAGTAKANIDYVSTEELLSWTNGDNEDKLFTVQLLGNSEHVEKTFTIALLDPNTLEEIGSTGVTIVAALDDSLVAEPVVGKKPVIDPNSNGSDQETTISPTVENNGPKCTLSICEKLVKEPKPSTLQFSKTNYLVNEGDGEFTIEVGRINGSDGEVSVKVVPIAGDGMATLGEDYLLESATLTWETGNISTQTVTWLILDDEDYEGNETAVLGLSVESGNVNFADSQPVVLTIVDNDIVDNDKPPVPPAITLPNETQCPAVQQCPQPRSGQFRFVETNYEVSEDAGTVQIDVSRADILYNGCQREVLLEYVVANESTATLNSDYTHPNLSLNKGNKSLWQIWQNGECGTKPIILNIIDDQKFEDDEKLVLRLLEVGDDVSLATSQQTELTIVDNDKEIVPESTCLLPSLGEGIVEPDKSEPSDNATTFAGGIAIDNCYFQTGYFIGAEELIEIKGEIMVPSEDIGKTAEILMFATYKATPTAVEQGFMKVGDEILAWDITKTATAIKAAETVRLEAKQAVNIYTGFLPLGELKIYFGYRLQNESAIIFNGRKPIRVVVED
jgi:hypothetical protein